MTFVQINVKLEIMSGILKLEENENLTEKICKFMNIENLNLTGETFEDKVKEIVVARVCSAVGLKCEYNYKNKMFEFFSTIAGEAVCQLVGIRTHIAGDELRLVKYERFNLIEQVKEYFDRGITDESVIDAFNFVERFKYVLEFMRN